MSGVRITLTRTIEAGPDSIWFDEECLSDLSDAELREWITDDLWDFMEGATMTFERMA